MGNKLIRRILGIRERVTVANAHVPEGTLVYAVGDIHGRVDLLRRLHDSIRADADKRVPEFRRVVVYLGDYIDRGLQSRKVLDFLLDNPLDGFECVYLKGNHEEQFLEFLNDVGAGGLWLKIGGDAMLHSYGISISKDVSSAPPLPHLQEIIRNSLPEKHLEFLSRLELSLEIGDYFFVHAGVNPYEPLERQVPEDMLWIRDEFLFSDANYGMVVVHGHSVTDTPDIHDNRIGIDTGAYASNNLTCLVLEGSSKRFLTTTRSPQG